MLTEMKFTDVRKDLTTVIDKVQSLIPMVIQPRKNSEGHTIMISDELMGRLLSEYEFNLERSQEEDGSFTYGLDSLELYVNAPTMDAALTELAKDVLDYSKRYFENISFYMNSPNRRSHLPYLFRVMLCDNYKEVKLIINERYAEI